MTGQVLTTASRELFTRPSDEHFGSMQELLDAARADMDRSSEVHTENKSTFFEVDGDSFKLNLSNNTSVGLTHYALLQIARLSKIPVDMIERLLKQGRPDLVVDNLNTLFARVDDSGQDKSQLVLLHENKDESKTAYAITGMDYSRLYDWEVFNALNEWLIPAGFVPAFPTLYTNENADNIMGNNKPCLFRGDQTSFGFFFTDKGANEDGLGGLRQGLMVWNSEVGARSFGWSDFYLQDMCANFLIWGAQNISTQRFIHRGNNIYVAFSKFQRRMREALEKMEDRRKNDMTIFARAARTPFADDVDKAIERLNKEWKMSQSQAQAVITAAALPQNRNGNFLSVWNVANGITYEAGATSRAEALVDNSTVAARMIRKLVKV